METELETLGGGNRAGGGNAYCSYCVFISFVPFSVQP